MRYWMTGDLHLCHGNIIRYCHRPFTSAHEMDECFISNWNKIVVPEDHVYCVGDFSFSDSPEEVEGLIKRFNGQIHLVYGNHDKKGVRQARTFASAKEYMKISLPWKGKEQEIILFHYSCRVWDKSHYGTWMLYGHSHGTLPEDMNVKSFDVGIDAFAQRLAKKAGRDVLPEDYRPASLEEIAEEMEKHGQETVDHHGN